MRGWHDLDPAGGQIKAAILAALDHAGEFLPNVVGPEMRHFDMDAALRCGVALAHLVIDGAADDVAGCPFATLVIAEHESLAIAVQQDAAGAAKPFFQHRTGHPRVVACQQTGRMELHHFHVAERQPGTKRHGKAIHRLVAGRGVVAVHGWPAAGRHEHCFRPDQPEDAAAHVDHQHTGKPVALPAGDQGDGAVFLQPFDRAAQYLFHQPVDDLDPGQIALVDCPVCGLSGKGLLMQRAVGISVEEAADFIFKLMDTFDGGTAQTPCHVLVGKPFAAIDGVHEMALHRITAAKRHIVATLNHAGAAAFADQALDRHRDLGAFRGALLGVKRGEQTGAAGAEDQDVGIMAFK